MKIDSLIFIRFIAALIVINFHYGKNIFDLGHFYNAGQQMVTFFFVLSGFVLGFSSYNKQTSWGSFMRSRLIRIAPLYFLGLGAMIAIFALTHRYIDQEAIIYNLFFAQSLMPTFALSFNYPAWFISTQMALYALFLPFLWLFKRFSLAQGIIFSMILWSLIQVASIILYQTVLHDPSNITIRDILFYNPLIHLPSFLLGVIAGIAFLQNPTQINSLRIVLTSTFILIICLEFYPQINQYLQYPIPFGASFFAPLFALLIWIFAKYANFGFFSHKYAILLGNASFAIYILHAPIHMGLDYLIDIDMTNLTHFIFYGFIAVGIGIIAHLQIETKLAIKLNQLIKKL